MHARAYTQIQYTKLYKLNKYLNNLWNTHIDIWLQYQIDAKDLWIVYALLFTAVILIYSVLYEDPFQKMILFKLCNLCNIWFTRLLIYSVVRERVAAGTRLCSSILTLAPLQPVDNYFVYVISDLISAFVNPAEYLRYGETVSTWSRLKQKRAFISRHAQTQFIHAIYGLWSERFLVTLTSRW